MNNSQNEKLIELDEKLHELTMLIACLALERYDDASEEPDPLGEAVELLTKAELIVDSQIEHSETFLLLKANGKHSRVNIPYPEFCENAYKLVDCESFELVSIREKFYFVVDELGKVRENPKPVNPKASLFYPGSLHGDMIVGDVLIGKHGYVDGEADIVGLSEDELKYFESFFEVIK